MAKYQWTAASETLGQPPALLTDVCDGALSDWTVVSRAGALGGQALKLTGTGSVRRRLVLSGVDIGTGRVDVRGRFFHDSTSTTIHFVALRIKGSAASNNYGYHGFVNGGTGLLAIGRYAPSYADVASAGITVADIANQWVNFRYTFNPNATGIANGQPVHRLAIWLDDGSDTAPDYALITDSVTASVDGTQVGFGGLTAIDDEFDWLTVGTGTDDANVTPTSGAAELAGDAIASAQASAQLVETAAELAGDATVSVSATGALVAQTTTLITDIDAGNADPATASVTNADSDTPTIETSQRVAADGDGGWRHFLFAVEGVEDKTPIFRWAKANHRMGGGFTSAWAPVYTTDFVTWTKASARTFGATWIEWSFDAPLPAGRVYVASHPMGRQSDSTTFAAYLLTTHASVAAPAASADASGVYNTTPAENDDLGRAVGSNPQYAIKLAWGGSTTDGYEKRKLVMLAGMHAAGEHHSWPGFVAAVTWMLSDASQAAQDFRANWNVWLYFNVTPNGLKGGNARWNFRSAQDPNRDWKLTGASVLQEITTLRAAIEGDTGTSADALYSFHGAAARATRWNLFLYSEDYTAGTRRPIIQAMLDLGASIFGVAGSLINNGIDSADFGWAKNKLGAKIYFATEMQGLGESSQAEAELVGRSWVQTLQALDAAGHFTGIAGDALASAQASGALSGTPADLASASVVAATATGSLSTGISLLGAAVSLALSDGVLTAQIRLQSSALAAAMAAAGLTTAIQLAAAAQGGASASGDLTTAGSIDLAGSAAAAALAAGSITAHIRLAASAVAQAIAQGALESGIALNGAALAAALSAGDIMTAIRMAADALAAGSASGALSTTPAGLSADATALALAEGGLTTAIRLQGAAASVMQATGTLDVAITFDAAAFAAAMASGVLSTQIRMDAVAVAGALAAANLTGGLPMVPPAERTIPVRAQTRVIPVRAQTRVIPA